MFSVIIQNEDKRITRIQALGGNGCMFDMQEEIYIAGRVNAVKKHGVISREKGESDKQFALRLLQKTQEQ